MGRNDSCFVDALSFIRKSLVFFITLLFVGVSFYNISFAQAQKGEEEEEIMTYKVDFWLPPTIRNHYSYNERTEVTRVYSDSSVFTYSRELTYFYNVKAPNPRNEGFTTLEITLDSMKYKFKKGEYEYSYNSQGSEPANFKLTDCLANVVPLGNFFTITYSPYGNVSKLEGEELEEFLQSSVIDKKDAFEPIDYFVWKDGLSNERLIHIADFKKIHYPHFEIAEDSAFISPIVFQLNHINIRDTVDMTFEDISGGYMTFGGSFSGVKYFNDKVRFEGIDNYMVDVEAVDAKGTVETILTPRGTPEETTLLVDMDVTGKVKMEVFTEKVVSAMKWELLGQWEY